MIARVPPGRESVEIGFPQRPILLNDLNESCINQAFNPISCGVSRQSISAECLFWKLKIGFSSCFQEHSLVNPNCGTGQAVIGRVCQHGEGQLNKLPVSKIFLSAQPWREGFLLPTAHVRTSPTLRIPCAAVCSTGSCNLSG